MHEKSTHFIFSASLILNLIFSKTTKYLNCCSSVLKKKTSTKSLLKIITKSKNKIKTEKNQFSCVSSPINTDRGPQKCISLRHLQQKTAQTKLITDIGQGQ